VIIKLNVHVNYIAENCKLLNIPQWDTHI